jgi:heme-degrading monooxygenase HmoA
VYLVIFQATARDPDEEYARTAARLRELALRECGCLEFVSVTEGDREISLSYWRDEESIHAWKQHADHIMAQELGRARWYARYRVEVARIERSYRSPGG